METKPRVRENGGEEHKRVGRVGLKAREVDGALRHCTTHRLAPGLPTKLRKGLKRLVEKLTSLSPLQITIRRPFD